MKEIIAVECIGCGKIMRKTSDEFVSVYGNICIGEGGGLVGNNLDAEGKVSNVSIYCRKCFKHYILSEIEYETIYRGEI